MTEEETKKAKALLKAAGLDSEISAILLRCSTLECVKSEIVKMRQNNITSFTQEHTTSNIFKVKV